MCTSRFVYGMVQGCHRFIEDDCWDDRFRQVGNSGFWVSISVSPNSVLLAAFWPMMGVEHEKPPVPQAVVVVNR